MGGTLANVSSEVSEAEDVASDMERKSWILAAMVEQVFQTLLYTSEAFERLHRALDRLSL